MVTSNARKSFAIGFTIFNLLFIFPILAVAYVAPLGLGGSSYHRIALFFVIFTWCSPLSVPIGIYKGWKCIDSPSITPFLFYHFLPLITFGIVMFFCTLVTYWLW